MKLSWRLAGQPQVVSLDDQLAPRPQAEGAPVRALIGHVHIQAAANRIDQARAGRRQWQAAYRATWGCRGDGGGQGFRLAHGPVHQNDLSRPGAGEVHRRGSGRSACPEE